MKFADSQDARLLKEAGRQCNRDGLPAVPGGWTIRDVAVGSQTFRLTLPADPDEFLGDAETLAAGPKDDDYVPYWPHLWPAALSMAEVIQIADWPTGTLALELGCGVGLVGLAGLAVGLKVTFSDYEPAAVQLAVRNATNNGFDNAQSLLLDWKQPLPRRFPLILACDVLYETRHHLPLLELLEAMLDRDGECWIGDPGRQHAAVFVELARQHHFAVALSDERGTKLPSPHIGRFQLMKLRKSSRR